LPAPRTLPALLLTLATATALALPLAAHDFWVVPSSFRPAPGGPLAVRLLVGERLQGDAVPRDPMQVERFAVIGPMGGPAGEEPIAGPPGSEPAGYLRAGAPGLHWIVYDSARTRTELAAADFEKALRLEGLERVTELRRKRGQTGKPATEVYSRCAKALVRVGDGSAPGSKRGFDRVAGLPLELVPEADPTTLATGTAGAELPLRLLYGGKPLAGALVAALHARHREGTIAGRTDAAGRVRLRLPEGGFWLVKAVHMVPAPADTKAEWESFWASLTFDVPSGSPATPGAGGGA
jgi:uncharacterized GH25 family protein